MKKKYIIGISIALVIAILAIVLGNSKEDKVVQLETKVKRGEFEILVTTTGELQSSNSEKIMGPRELGNRSMGIREVKIQDLIPEGTVVDSGDYVANLDRSEVSLKLKDIEDEIEKLESQYLKTKLDTTIKLRDLRDELVNLEFAKEEARIRLEQSKFEPPATIRQAKIDVDRAERSYNQAVSNYSLKVRQAEADIREAEINLQKQVRSKESMMDLLNRFTIYAPSSGMVIYTKEWGGQKRKVGSTINPWDLTVATLPDLTSMRSKTYVNEIDISKVKKGQLVKVGVDAFPDKTYTGEVIDVANIGEQLPNTDAKVFEVIIKVNESDPILRPAMTTSNAIQIKFYEEVLFLPLEAVFVNDSLSYVYTKNGKRQVVVLGDQNNNEIIIEQGLKEGQTVFLSVPEKVEKFKWANLELMDIIKERKAREQAVQDSIQKAQEIKNEKMKNRGMRQMTFKISK